MEDITQEVIIENMKEIIKVPTDLLIIKIIAKIVIPIDMIDQKVHKITIEIIKIEKELHNIEFHLF
jgi:hypothetical protein